MEKYNFVGQNLTPEKIEKAEIGLRSSSVIGSWINKKELLKTGEEEKIIKTTQGYIGEKLNRIGVKSKALDINKMHAYSPEDFKNKYWDEEEIKNNSGSHALYEPRQHSVIFTAERIKDYSKVDVIRDNIHAFLHLTPIETVSEKGGQGIALTHENLHAQGYRKFLINENKDKESGIDVNTYRIGYSLHNKKDDAPYRLFHGFNEAVVQKLTLDILNENKKDFCKKFKIKEKYFLVTTKNTSSYEYQVSVLNKIIKRVAEHTKKSEAEVWDTIAKGHFTGNMMHLRDIEKTFGEGSLRMLASMPSRESKIMDFLRKLPPPDRNVELQNILINSQLELIKRNIDVYDELTLGKENK